MPPRNRKPPTSLEFTRRWFLAAVGGAIASAIFVLASPTAGVLSIPILCLPAIYMNYCSLIWPDPRYFETLIWTFLGSGTVGLALISVAFTWFNTEASMLLFGNRYGQFLREWERVDFMDFPALSTRDMRTRAGIAWSWEYLVFMGLFAVGRAFLESLLRYIVIAWARRSGSLYGPPAYLQCAIVATLGMETTRLIIALCRYGFSSSSLLLAVFALLGFNIHVEFSSFYLLAALLIDFNVASSRYLYASLLALGLIKRDLEEEDVGLVEIFGYPVFYQFVMDYTRLALVAITGDIGPHHSSISICWVLWVALSIVQRILVYGQLRYQWEQVRGRWGLETFDSVEEVAVQWVEGKVGRFPGRYGFSKEYAGGAIPLQPRQLVDEAVRWAMGVHSCRSERGFIETN